MVRTAPLALFVLSCATIAAEGHGDRDLPNAHAGPFRELANTLDCTGGTCTGVNELPSSTGPGQPGIPSAPPSRSPVIVVRGAGNGDYAVTLFVAHDRDPLPSRIGRYESRDARVFVPAGSSAIKDDASSVFAGDAPFESNAIGDPAAIVVDGTLWLFYAIKPNGDPKQRPGIARAIATDGSIGKTFRKGDAPALGIDGNKGSWETEAPRAPSVMRDEAGVFHLFYASGNAIGEATSTDGAIFVRVDADPSTPVLDPVLAPSPAVDPATLPVGVKPPFDDLAVDDPCVVRSTTAIGRPVVELFYAGKDRDGGSGIGFAGRYGDGGTFDRNAGIVYGGRKITHPRAPAIAVFPDLTLLFADKDGADGKTPVMALAVSPSTIFLPFGG